MKSFLAIVGGVVLGLVLVLVGVAAFGPERSDDQQAYDMARYFVRDAIRKFPADPDDFKIDGRTEALGAEKWQVRGTYKHTAASAGPFDYDITVHRLPGGGDRWRVCDLTMNGQAIGPAGAC